MLTVLPVIAMLFFELEVLPRNRGCFAFKRIYIDLIVIIERSG